MVDTVIRLTEKERYFPSICQEERIEITNRLGLDAIRLAREYVSGNYSLS